MGGLWGVPQQNAHSVLPREGAEEEVENGRVVANTSTECAFSTPQRGCKGGGGTWQGYVKYLNRVHIQYSPERVQMRGWKMRWV